LNFDIKLELFSIETSHIGISYDIIYLLLRFGDDIDLVKFDVSIQF